MEGGNVFVEVDREKVEGALAVLLGLLIVLQYVVVVIGGFSCQRTDLFVAACVAWDEKDGDALDLRVMSAFCYLSMSLSCTHARVLIDASLTIQVQ